jgi:6-phosphogluconolactonase (cycloisomerase 2 family)
LNKTDGLGKWRILYSIKVEGQEAPHPHSVFLHPGNRFALVPDLGLDQIVIYAIDSLAGKLIRMVKLQPGAGPLHLVFHNSQPYVYCINELDSTISAFIFDTQAGSLAVLQILSTLPEGLGNLLKAKEPSGMAGCFHQHASDSSIQHKSFFPGESHKAPK